MARLIGTIEGEWAQRDGESFYPDYVNRLDDLLKEEQRKSRELADGQLVGKVISFRVADGSAFYKVVSTLPLTLIHIPYGDCYQIPDAYMRGLRVSDILDLIDD